MYNEFWIKINAVYVVVYNEKSDFFLRVEGKSISNKTRESMRNKS